ncbi:MAG TPA: hypothetical protein VGE72_23825 [Azospirillum sp.]
MPLQSNPAAFSITALLADQVALIARHEGVSPGAAALLLRQCMDGRGGRRRLLTMFEREMRREVDPTEAAKIAVVHTETAAWLAAMEDRSGR